MTQSDALTPRFPLSLVVSGILVFIIGFMPVDLEADTVTLTSGEVLDGVIESIDDGRVTISIAGDRRELDIRNVDHIDFNTPHLPDLVDMDEVAHYLGDVDAQEMVSHVQELREVAGEIDGLLDEIRGEWDARNPIEPGEAEEWETAKEQFRRPVSRYQEVLAELYFHIVAHVDEYHRLMQEANDVYVGVEGIFRVGSSLVPRDLRQLPLQSYMPRNWYDAIYYEGYYVGYDDAYRELDPELNPDQ